MIFKNQKLDSGIKSFSRKMDTSFKNFGSSINRRICSYFNKSYSNKLSTSISNTIKRQKICSNIFSGTELKSYNQKMALIIKEILE
jgi:hypothetical protein